MAEAREKGAVRARSSSCDGDCGCCALGMSNVANWVTKFDKSTCGPWPCQKFNPDTRLKLTLPVPECFASRAIIHTHGAKRRFGTRHQPALATICLEKEDHVSIITTVHTSELTKNRMQVPEGDVRVRHTTITKESSLTLPKVIGCPNCMPRRRQYCDGIGSTRSSE